MRSNEERIAEVKRRIAEKEYKKDCGENGLPQFAAWPHVLQ